MTYTVTYYLNSLMLFNVGALTMTVDEGRAQYESNGFAISGTFATLELAKKGVLRGQELGAQHFEIKPRNENGAAICIFTFIKGKYTPVLQTQGKSELTKPFKELFAKKPKEG